MTAFNNESVTRSMDLLVRAQKELYAARRADERAGIADGWKCHVRLCAATARVAGAAANLAAKVRLSSHQ